MNWCKLCVRKESDNCKSCTSDGNYPLSRPSHFIAAIATGAPMPTIEPLDNLIDHPPHYTVGKIEVIDYIVDKLTAEQFEGYCIGNVLKYVSRYRHKGGHEDLKKAVWYLNRVIETEEK